MNAIVNTIESNVPVPHLPEETESLINASVAENTRKAYRRALHALERWLAGRSLSDELLATYITTLHKDGKSPATIGQVLAAVKWQLKHQSTQQMNLSITLATLSGIRRDGKERGRGQVDGLIWQEVGTHLYYCRNRRHTCRLTRCRDDPPHERLSFTDWRSYRGQCRETSQKTHSLIGSSKTDQEGTGESLYICEPTRKVAKAV